MSLKYLPNKGFTTIFDYMSRCYKTNISTIDNRQIYFDILCK